MKTAPFNYPLDLERTLDRIVERLRLRAHYEDAEALEDCEKMRIICTAYQMLSNTATCIFADEFRKTKWKIEEKTKKCL